MLFQKKKAPKVKAYDVIIPDNDPRFIDRDEVQFFLDYRMEVYDTFRVIFLAKDGEQRDYIGQLEDKGVRNDWVSFKELEYNELAEEFQWTGEWKKFHIGRVLSIQKVENQL